MSKRQQRSIPKKKMTPLLSINMEAGDAQTCLQVQ